MPLESSAATVVELTRLRGHRVVGFGRQSGRTITDPYRGLAFPAQHGRSDWLADEANCLGNSERGTPAIASDFYI